MSRGLSREAALDSVHRLHLRRDRVADYLEAGPHAGQLFAGTHHVDTQPRTATCSTAAYWSACRLGGGAGVGDLALGTAFPDLAPRFDTFPDELAAILQEAVRISLVLASRPMTDPVLRRA